MRLGVICTILVFLLPGILHAQTGNGWRVAFVDSGLMSGDTQGRNKTPHQRCYSLQDQINRFSTLGSGVGAQNGGFDRYLIASTCKNGLVSSTATNSAIVPRTVLRTGNPVAQNTPGRYHNFGSSHGSNVVRAYRDTATGGGAVMINATHFNSLAEFPNGSNCGGTGIASDNFNYQSHYCYRYRINNLELALDKILQNYTSNLAAVSLSLGVASQSLCNTSRIRDQVDQLVARGIAVIAAVGNDSADVGPNDYVNAPSWPACLPNVISVAALTSSGNIATYSNTRGRVTFWETGTSLKYNGGFTYGTSYAAPRVAAAYAKVRSAVPSATLTQITNALLQTGISKTDNRTGTTAKRLTPTTVSQAITAVQQAMIPVPGSSTSTPADISDIPTTDGYGTRYGSTDFPNGVAFRLTIEGDGAIRRSSDYFSTDPDYSRRYELKYTAWDIDYTGEVQLFINGQYYRNLYGTGNQVTEDHVLTLASTALTSGSNILEFRVPGGASQDWHISNISVSRRQLGSRVLGYGRKSLFFSNLGTNPYGYSQPFADSASSYTDVLPMLFYYTKSDGILRISAIGYDIDTPDEMAVVLNRKHLLGFLSESPSSQYNSGDTFIVPPALLDEGANYIRFEQRSPDYLFNSAQDLRWGIKDVLIENYPPPIPAINLLLGDD